MIYESSRDLDALKKTRPRITASKMGRSTMADWVGDVRSALTEDGELLGEEELGAKPKSDMSPLPPLAEG